MNATQCARADYDGDGSIGLSDLTQLMSSFGTQTAVSNYVKYTWDAENRLIGVEPLARPIQNGWQRVEFDYDYRGRRIEKRVYDKDTTTPWEANPTQRRRFVWNGWLMVMEIIDIDSASDGTFEAQRVKKYTWGRDIGGSLESAGGIGGLLAVHDHNGASADINAVYCYDANGNVGQVVDPVQTSLSAGTLAKYEYDVYGNVTSSGGTYATANTYRFSTKPWDDETGLGDWGRRLYEPRTGRWISRDLVEYPNLYFGMQNNAVMFVDPDGRMAMLPSSGYICGKWFRQVLLGPMGRPLPPFTVGSFPPGDCTQDEHDELTERIDRFCKSEERNAGDPPRKDGKYCPDEEYCNRALKAAQTANACRNAREEINQKCYGGGDYTHQLAEEEAVRAWENAKKRFNKHCNRTGGAKAPCPAPALEWTNEPYPRQYPGLNGEPMIYFCPVPPPIAIPAGLLQFLLGGCGAGAIAVGEGVLA